MSGLPQLEILCPSKDLNPKKWPKNHWLSYCTTEAAQRVASIPCKPFVEMFCSWYFIWVFWIDSDETMEVAIANMTKNRSYREKANVDIIKIYTTYNQISEKQRILGTTKWRENVTLFLSRLPNHFWILKQSQWEVIHDLVFITHILSNIYGKIHWIHNPMVENKGDWWEARTLYTTQHFEQGLVWLI